MTLVFATNNNHKFKEVSKMLPDSIKLLSLRDIEADDDLPETGNTIKSNALQKARYVYEKFGMNCFADDTGLEVVALNGEPGVYSARYAGPSSNSNMNIKKLLHEMKGVADRRASFQTVIALYLEGEEFFFDGKINGTITEELAGESGFGYDPVFIPEGSNKTFAEMGEEEKNKMSHRAIAIKHLANFLMSRT